MDEQSFPMIMELLNCMEGEKEDGCQDAVESLLEDAVRIPTAMKNITAIINATS